MRQHVRPQAPSIARRHIAAALPGRDQQWLTRETAAHATAGA